MSLDHRIRTVLAQLEIRLHYGSITAYNSSGSGGKAEGGGRPPGDSRPPHDRYRTEYIACDDDHCRVRVCERAEEALEALTSFKAGEVKGETLEELYGRLTQAKYEGEDPKDIAHWERVTPSQVRKARVALAKHVETGKPTMDLHSLFRQGKGVREASRLSGRSLGTVSRLFQQFRSEAA